ncbi:MAG: hypothetical protein HZC24_02440, partial [Rhodocyclales bacterium]|nr:hypothetical protein [Rhodocyclales bacterium]
GNYVDGHGTQETANSMPAAILASLAGKTADVAVYAWKTHPVLGGVTLAQSTPTQTTAADGHASFSGVTGTSLALTADRPIPGSEASATASAVNLHDSIAILKMIVGLDSNGTGKALSPYQAYAADFDGDGRVQLNDAIGVLKHVVGVQAPSPQWLFFNETNALPGWVATNPGSAPALTADIASATATVRVGLVGVLRGDVDGSYSGPAGTATVESTDAAYFQNLMATTALDLSQFGIYG